MNNPFFRKDRRSSEHKVSSLGIAVLVAFAFVRGALILFEGLSSGGNGRLLTVDHVQLWSNYFLIYDTLHENCFFYALVSYPFIAGVGVLLRKAWGRVMYIWGCLMLLGFLGYEAISLVPENIVFTLFYLMLFSFPIWYLHRPNVKEQFK